jgi:hypothetical protein
MLHVRKDIMIFVCPFRLQRWMIFWSTRPFKAKRFFARLSSKRACPNVDLFAVLWILRIETRPELMRPGILNPVRADVNPELQIACRVWIAGMNTAAKPTCIHNLLGIDDFLRSLSDQSSGSVNAAQTTVMYFLYQIAPTVPAVYSLRH